MTITTLQDLKLAYDFYNELQAKVNPTEFERTAKVVLKELIDGWTADQEYFVTNLTNFPRPTGV